MAASVVYSTFGGRVVAENRGGVIRQYVPDNLGSTVALLDTTGTVTDTYDYWPYGEERVHIGPSTTPLTFLGTLGYFKDFLNTLYVRARHLRVDLTRWMTVDSLYPKVRPYTYAGSAPAILTDPTGRIPILSHGGEIIRSCGFAIVGTISQLLGSLAGGGSSGGAWGTICRAGADCFGAIAGAILEVLLDEECPPCAVAIECLTGALGWALGALLEQLCPEPEDPCKPPKEPNPTCQVIANFVSAVRGCISEVAGSINVGAGGLESGLAGLVAGLTGEACNQ